MSSPTILSKPIGPVGFGMMGMTWRPRAQSVEENIQVLNIALEQGANFWDGGELYGTPDYNSCHLINAYFTKYPHHADTVVLSIKGALAPGELRPDGSEQNIRRSVEECLRIIQNKKSIDLFQCARVDPNVPIEESIKALAKLVQEGKIGSIGLSEVRASTIERAVAIHPIAAVEVELSLWATDILYNGVAATCAKLNIPIIAYSPLARGALTGKQVRSNAEIPEGDVRKHLPKFQDNVLDYNNKITDGVAKLAQKKGYTLAQIAISWVRALSGRTISTGENGHQIKLGTIIPIPGATKVARIKENLTLVDLTDEDYQEIEDILKSNPIRGDRHPPGFQQILSEG